MEKQKLFTLKNAKRIVKICGLGFFEYNADKDEGFNPDIAFETPELEEKVKAYMKAKKELEELLEIS